MGLIASSKKLMVKSEPPEPQNGILLGNRVIADVICENEMRSYLTRLGSSFNRIGVLVWREERHGPTRDETMWQQRQRLEQVGGWDEQVSCKWRYPRIADSHQDLGTGKEGLSLTGFRGKWPYWHFDFRLLASALWVSPFLLLQATLFLGLHDGSPSKPIWHRITIISISCWAHSREYDDMFPVLVQLIYWGISTLNNKYLPTYLFVTYAMKEGIESSNFSVFLCTMWTKYMTCKYFCLLKK